MIDWAQFTMLVSVLGIINGLVLWAVRMLIKRHSEDIGVRIEELNDLDDTHTQKIERLRSDLDAHRLDAARQYLHREDAVIFFGRAEQKIDAIWQFLHERFARGPE